MKVPLLLKIAVLVAAATAFYTYVGQLVPQKEVYPPAEVELKTNMSTDEMVKVGRQIMEGKGLCFTCHTVGKQGALRFPDLQGIGERARTSRPGLTDVQYLSESLYHPDGYIVPGFNPGMPVINKPPIGLTDQEILTVIATLQSMGGTATVTMDTKLPEAAGEAGALAATVAGGTPAGGPTSGTTAAPATQAATATVVGVPGQGGPIAGTGATPVSVATADAGSGTGAEDPLRQLRCERCHRLDAPGKGGLPGPSLFGIGKRMDATAISVALVRAHADSEKDLTLGQIQTIARRLAGQKGGG